MFIRNAVKISDPVSARSAVSNLELVPKFISGESKIRDCRKCQAAKLEMQP